MKVQSRCHACMCSRGGHRRVLFWGGTGNRRKCSKSPLMQGPLSAYDDCAVVHYRLQLNLYKYILEANYGMKAEYMRLIYACRQCLGSQPHALISRTLHVY
eukprot:890897-Amphidinium_carterae.2